MCAFDYKILNYTQNPDSLVIFLHGYNGNIEDHGYALEWLKKYLQNSVIIVPEAPETCDKNPKKRQWFGMLKYDAENLRYNKNTTPEQIFSIYENTGNEIAERAAQINDFVTKMQEEYQITAQKTYLIGFSQGAMLTLFAALSNQKSYGGAFILSGLVAGANRLVSEIKARPPMYFFHGKEDGKVQYKTLALTEKWLQKNHVEYKLFTYPHLAHKISEDEILKISKIIAQKQS